MTDRGCSKSCGQMVLPIVRPMRMLPPHAVWNLVFAEMPKEIWKNWLRILYGMKLKDKRGWNDAIKLKGKKAVILSG